MTVTIPKTLQKRVKERAHDLDMTEREYVRTVLEKAVKEESALDEEARMWMDASRHDALAFWKKHKL